MRYRHGVFLLLLGLADLLGLGGLHYGFGERLLIYVGGILLCLIGYFMARRLPRTALPPEAVVQTTSVLQPTQNLPPGTVVQTSTTYPPGTVVQTPQEYLQTPPTEEF